MIGVPWPRRQPEAVQSECRADHIDRTLQGILLIVIAGVVNFLMGWLAKRTGQRNHSLALESSGRHLLSDAYSTFGLIAGLILLRVTEIAWLDSAVAIVFGLIIFVTGYRILRRSIAGIMDEADEALLRELIAHLNEVRRESWVDIHNLRIIKYGSVLHIDCHLTVPWYFHVQQSHFEVDALERLVRDRYGDRVELFVHTDGCRPAACGLCSLEICPERQYPFTQRLDWTLENVLSNERHSLDEE